MSETVTVALLGRPEHAFDNDAFTWREDDEEGGPREFDIAWDDLPKVTLEVDESEILMSVLARALRESRIEIGPGMDPDHPPVS